ncbi:MAG: D-glycero-alpha-D-manno-heptose-1,7-bisphosphate 7-phosphatase [Bacteroidota bacterium]
MQHNKCVFLDRDGVINNNEHAPFTWQIENFFINEGVIEFMHLCRKKGYLLVLISNQGAIALNYYTRYDTDILHDYLAMELAKHNLAFDAMYYCPHHHTVEKCICRKPDSGMLEKAMARFAIDPERSFFIGDSTVDIKAGEKAGLHSIKIQANENLMNYTAILE